MRLGPFRGIDRRPGAADEAGGLYDALNVIVNSERALIRRPALARRATLPADSIGAYSVGDELRTLAPYDSGDETADDPLSPTIAVDYIQSSEDPTELLGHVTDSTGRTMALVRYADGGTEMHHCPAAGLAASSPTLVSGLGFTPDFSLVRAAGRGWTLDRNLKYLRYSNVDSTDPAKLEDFTSGQDLSDGSGYLQVAQFAAGAGFPQALGNFGGRMVVFYRGAVLIYNIDVDQSRFYLEQTITGPGTTSPRSVVDLGSDTIFMSEAGVRVLSTVTTTLDAREDAVGGKIDPLALAYASPVGMQPIGHYARRLGCYLLSFGQDVLCLSVLPGSAVLGWTRWRLPFAVEAWAEAGGLTWIRSGTALYALEDGRNQDEAVLDTFTDIPVLVETLPMRKPAGALASTVGACSPEPVRVQAVVDGRPSIDINGQPMGLPITLPGRAPEVAATTVGKYGRTFAVRVHDPAAQSGWRLDDLWIGVDPAGSL